MSEKPTSGRKRRRVPSSLRRLPPRGSCASRFPACCPPRHQWARSYRAWDYRSNASPSMQHPVRVGCWLVRKAGGMSMRRLSNWRTPIELTPAPFAEP